MHLFCTLLLLLLKCVAGFSRPGVTSYHGHSFSHMKIHVFNGKEFLVLAQKNELVHLQSDFKWNSVTHIGPRNDSGGSPIITLSKDSKHAKPSDIYVKAMDIFNKHLYVCLSYLQGSCDKVRLTDSTLKVNFSAIEEKLKSETLSGLCPNPRIKTVLTVVSSVSSNESLYVGMEQCNTKNNQYLHAVESVISIINLQTLRPFVTDEFTHYRAEILPDKDMLYSRMLTYYHSFNYRNGSFTYVYYLLGVKVKIKEDLQSRYMSRIKIARLCTSDKYLTSYVEALVNCSLADEDNAQFDHSGDAAALIKPGFKLSQSIGVPQEERMLLFSIRFGSNFSHQGICVVPMSEINSQLDQIVSDCRRGEKYAHLGPEYLREEVRCSNQSRSAAFGPFCSLNNAAPNSWWGIVSVNKARQIIAKPLLRISERVRSLAGLALQNGATVVFAGTHRGRLLRYHLQTIKRSWLFANSSATNSSKSVPVLNIIAGSDKVYTLTPTEVRSYRYADCQNFQSCSACLGSKNPHCVWSNSDAVGCRVWDQPGVPDNKIYVTTESNCMQISSVENQEINVDTSASSVFVSIDARNSPSAAFHCFTLDERGRAVVESRPAESELFHVDALNKIKCLIPIAALRSFLGNETKRHLTLLVSGNKLQADTYFASLNILVFTCHTHKNCSECVNSHYKCKWCSQHSKCVQEVALECPRGTFGDSVIRNSSQCPFIRLASPKKLVVPSGTNLHVQYLLNGYRAFMHTFTCSLICSGFAEKHLHASLKPDRKILSCHIGTLTYDQSTATSICNLTLYWKNSSTKQLLDSDTDQLIMYKCEHMAASCDSCTLYTKPKFNCKWCIDRCSDRCSNGGIQRGELCLPPMIHTVQPAKLTQFGNLLLNISGSNLGVTSDDVKASLTGSNTDIFPCALVSDTYQPGRAFTCRVSGYIGQPLFSLGTTVRVRVQLRKAQNATCYFIGNLSVYEPLLFNLSTSEVQQTGCAIMKAFGRNLDAGSSLQLNFLSDTFMPASVAVLSRTSNSLELRLSKFEKPGQYFVQLSVQENTASWILRNITLRVVNNVVPTVVPPVALLPAGGLPFRITGKHLSAVQRAQLLLSDLSGPGRIKIDCQYVKSTFVCPSPTMTLRRQRRTTTDRSFNLKTNFSATLMLDEIPHDGGRMTLLPQPQLMRLKSNVVLITDDSKGTQELRIQAQHLLASVRSTDIQVTVGHLNCPVLSLQPLSDGLELVVCTHELKPRIEGAPLAVKAIIGNKVYMLGTITYNRRLEVASYLYVAGGMAVALVVTCCIASVVHLLRRSSRQEKSRRVEVQINLLEAQVSQNCRDAFAELQLNSSGDKKLEESFMPAPIRSFEEFACCSCFPERYRDRHRSQDPIFPDVCPRSFVSESGEVRKALNDFHNLLRNEDFLMSMIAAMESRSDEFKHHERNQFGSLLSALLYYDIDYFTRVLTRLVQALVTKKSEANDNYKVVFRRCDSVAERLLPNWLAFLMYEQLATRVAEPLYQLHCGIKQQVYKGPVDQITEDSKYTINEQKLLKKEIHFKELIINFEDRWDLFSRQLSCQVAVLDCDSVCQVKEKVLDAVYGKLRVPYSRRENSHSFVLAKTQYDAEQIAADGKEQFVELKEVEDVDADNVRRLCQLSSFLPSDTASTVFFLKRRLEFAGGSGQRSMSRGGPSYPEILSLPSANSCRSLQDARQISSSSSRLRQSEPRYCHLLPTNANAHTIERTYRKKRKRGISERSDSQQIVSEVFYPVLLRTKRLLADRITDLFSALFPVERPEQAQPVPLCIKYLFDVFDDLAHEKQLNREVAHVWKANALMLRFYTHNLLNLDCLLDLAVPGPVKFCMSTVSTLFMDSCSVEKPSTPDKSSPAQKLLFVNEISDFHPQVEGYFKRIADGIREPVPIVFQRFHEQVKLRKCKPFNTDALLFELFHGFARKYHDDIVQQLMRVSGSDSLTDCLAFVSRTLGASSSYCSNSHTLCSTHSSTKPLNAGNVYDNA